MKIGIIGSNQFSDQFADAVNQVAGFEGEITYSRRIKTAEEKKSTWGFAHATDNLDSLLESTAEVIYLGSPNSLHYGHIMACLNAGKHVICEKPMVTTMAEYDAAYALADEKSLYLFEAYRHINAPNFKVLQKEVQNIGKVRYANLVFSKISSKYNEFKKGIIGNAFNPKMQGGALNDLAVYPIAVAMGLFGPWQSLTYNKTLLENGVDGQGVITLQYPDMICNIMFSKIANSHNLSEICGEQGEIIIENIGLIEKLIINGQEVNENILENDMVYEATRFLDIIQNNDQNTYRQLCKISRLTCKILDEAANKKA
ncbi:MAG: Gfo/Idh/MocA family protein [Alphaproteobacteria bacterium]